MNRLTSKEAAEYLGCGLSKLRRMTRAGLMAGTYYTIGNRRLYITAELDWWKRNGGEMGALERKEHIAEHNTVPLRAVK